MELKSLVFSKQEIQKSKLEPAREIAKSHSAIKSGSSSETYANCLYPDCSIPESKLPLPQIWII